MRKRKVLVTGLNGSVGTVLRPALEKRYLLSSLSRRGVSGLRDRHNFLGDIAELKEIRPAFSGIDSVVHLAATGGINSPRGTSKAFEDLLPTNVVGTYNVFEAAVEAGVRRLVFASTGATVRGYEKSSPYRELVGGAHKKVPGTFPRLNVDVQPRPMSFYGVTKLFGETLGRYYAETTDLSVICLRIGSIPSNNWPQKARSRAIFLSHRDLTDLVVRSIEAPAEVHFDIFYGVSDNARGYRDLSHAREVLGYIPRDDSENTSRGKHVDPS